jgi:hypothetical protein
LAEKALGMLYFDPALALPSIMHHSETGDRVSGGTDANTNGREETAMSWTDSLAQLLATSGQPKLLYTTGKLTVIYFTHAFGSYGILIWAATLFYDIGKIVIFSRMINLSNCCGLLTGIKNPYASAFLFILGELPGNIVTIMTVDLVSRQR